MNDEVEALLRSLGIGAWLLGYDELESLIVEVADGKPYELDDILRYQAVRRAIGIAWRTNPEKMTDIMMMPLDRPPTPKKFVYAAADYLNGMR